jgi:hypothetical protein
MKTIGFSEDDDPSLFFLPEDESFSLVPEEKYEERARVHALNVLRMILLDAPLSHEVFPFVGLAFVSSIFGYVDHEWAVRNSSTMVFAAAMLRSVDSDKNASNTGATSNNAISVAELFRAYPSLPNFLLAVLKSCVDGMFQEQHVPPMLPILLLLARLQPVTLSGQDSITLADPLVPVILRCLDHGYLSVRKAAARALRNLSSGDKHSASSMVSILSTCEQNVRLVLDWKKVPVPGNLWNLLHGSLLTIRELLNQSVDVKQELRGMELYNDLWPVARSFGGNRRLPPPCLSLVVEILASLAGEEDSGLVLEVCDQIIARLELINGQTNLIGSAELGSRVASVSMNVITAKLWCVSLPPEERKVMLQRASSLMTSCQIDVRLTATKMFKKSIYHGIDALAGFPEGKDIVEYLTEVLLRALQTEISRDSDPGDFVGAHPPSLRRLSRCLLECLEANTRLGVVSKEFFDVTDVLLNRKLGTSAEGAQITLTSVEGNAVELISFFIAGVSMEDQRRFFSLVTRLSDPAGNWRLRHSAAVALGRSRVLQADSKTPSDIRLNMMFTWMSLMQDADVDVRYTAAKAVKWEEKMETLVSEFALAQSFYALCASLPRIPLVKALLTYLVNSTDGLEENLREVEEGREQVEGSLGGETEDIFVQDASQRKIFEVEDPNPYREHCLTGQLAVSALARYLSWTDRSQQSLVDVSRILLARCCRVLQELIEGFDTVTMLDATRKPNVFPSLHNMLLAICAVQSITDSRETVYRHVRRLAGSLVAQGSVLHQQIAQAVRCLAYESNESVSEVIHQCCFLLSAFIQGFSFGLDLKTTGSYCSFCQHCK